MSGTEKTHANNANNFVEKVNRLKQEGEEYNPSNPQIKMLKLEPMKKAVSDCILGVSQGKADVANAVMARKALYVTMDDLATRSVNMLKSSGASADEKAHASFLLSKYKGERIGDVPDEEELRAKAAANGEEPVIPKTISVSQQGFVNKKKKFTDIVVYLKTIAVYKPNEEALTTEGLDAFILSVGAANDARTAAGDKCTQAIATRNKLMYKEPDGAYFLSDMMMDYVAATSGKKSQLYIDLQKFPVTKMA
jgi:hypothetical protein